MAMTVTPPLLHHTTMTVQVQQLIEVGVTFVNTDMVRTFPEEL